MNAETIKKLVKAAVATAITNCAVTTGTWRSTYKEPTGRLIENTLITVITELNRLSVERENILLLKIEELTKKINGSSSANSANAIRAMLTSRSPEHREQQQQLCTLIDRQTKDVKERDTNIIIIGLAEKADVSDQVQVQQFLTAAGVGGVTPKHFRRLKPSKNNATNNSNILQVSMTRTTRRMYSKRAVVTPSSCIRLFSYVKTAHPRSSKSLTRPAPR
jgi:hypothetical protein